MIEARIELGGDKLAGPYGFMMAFWKFCGLIIGEEVMWVSHLRNFIHKIL